MANEKAMSASILEFIRFGITGIASLAVYLIVSNGLYSLGGTVWFSTFIAWVLSSLVSYFGHIYFSYRVTANHRTMSYKFVLMLTTHFLLTVGITYILADVLHVRYSLTTVITACSTPLATYPMGKYWVFREE